MPKQLVMDHNGHTEHVFDKADKVSLAEAERRFHELMKSGHVPAVLKEDGQHEVTRTFNPDVDTLFVPQLKGG